MARRVHYVKPNHATESPQSAVWFDTETHQDADPDGTITHRLWFGYAAHCYRRSNGQWTRPRWLRFTTREHLWEWVTQQCRPKVRTYMFCHNTNFDLPVMDIFHQLPAMGWTLKMAVIEAPPTILRWKKGTKTLQVLDTLNLWRMPLSKLGEMIGLPKLPMPAPDAPPADWDAYGKRDVEVIMAACLQWWDTLTDEDLGGFASTLAGQSMRAYRHRFMPARILIDDHPPALPLARESYMGGRCEAFRLGKVHELVTCLDINSQYPYVMRDNWYPTRLIGHTRRASLADLGAWLQRRCLVARVTLTTPEPAYAVRHNRKLCWPVGTFDAVLTSPELSYALERGHIDAVHEVAVYERAKLFQDFVEYFYARRLHYRALGDETRATQIKLILNSLYGKWGQKGYVYEPDEWVDDLQARVWTEIDGETGDIIRWRQLGGLLQRRAEEGESRESPPAIAAHVTAYGRALLWSMIRRADPRRVVYVDTDSLYIAGPVPRTLAPFIDPDKLGSLKIVGEPAEMVIHGAKDYVHGSHWKLKGARFSSLWTSPTTYEQDKWAGLKGLLRDGGLDAPTTERVTKTCHRRYDKGTVTASGRVVPLVFPL